MRTCGVMVAAAMLAVSQARAANIAESLSREAQFDREIAIAGEIVKGDSAKFHAAISRSNHALILMDSPGGNLLESITIGKDIRANGAETGDGGFPHCVHGGFGAGHA
jgi:hypothetical protein